MGNALPIGVTPSDLRPTQMTLGFREVEVKRPQWQAAGGEDRARILRRHVVPAVIGPRTVILLSIIVVFKGDDRRKGRADCGLCCRKSRQS